MLMIEIDDRLTHYKSKTQRESGPIFREEECISWLSQGSWRIWLDEAINANESHNFQAVSSICLISM